MDWYTLFLGAFAKLRKGLLAASCLHFSPSPAVFQPACKNSAPTGRFSMEFYIGNFYENLSRNSKICFKFENTCKSGTLPGDLSTFYCCRREINSTWKHCCATPNMFKMLTVSYRSTIQRKALLISIAKMVSRTYHKVTLSVHCTSCFYVVLPVLLHSYLLHGAESFLRS